MSPSLLALDGRYQMLECLGAGGMGTVYLARDLRLGRWVAIKEIRPLMVWLKEVRERFRREARTLATFSHPGLVRLFDCQVEGRVPYLVLEYVEGRSLSEILSEEGPLPPPMVLRIARELSQVLEVVHERGFCHRDLKPQNVILRGGYGSAVLLDMGLALDLASTTRMTSTGQILGTPGYCPPEVVHGEPWTPAGDWFQFGAVLFECLTGTRLIDGKSVMEMFGILRAGAWSARADLGPMVPRALNELVVGLVDADPERRMRNRRRLLAALHPPQTSPGTPDSVPERVGERSGIVKWARSGRRSSLRPPRPSSWSRLVGRSFLALLACSMLGFLSPVERSVSAPEVLSWGVIANALVVRFEPEGFADVHLRVPGSARPRIRPRAGDPGKIIFRGLRADREVQVQLAWEGGVGPVVGVRGEGSPIGPTLDLAGGRRVAIRVRRPCVVRWASIPQARMALTPGRHELPAPAIERASWTLLADEDQVVTARTWSVAEDLQKAATRLRARLEDPGARSEAERARAAISSWSGVALDSDLPRETRAAFMGLATSPASGETCGGMVLPTMPPAVAGALPPPLPLRRPGDRQVRKKVARLFTPSGLSDPLPSFLAADPWLEFDWPAREATEGEARVAVVVAVKGLPAGLSLVLEATGEAPAGSRPFRVSLAPPVCEGSSDEPYRGPLSLILPADLLPEPGRRMRLRVVAPGGSRVARARIREVRVFQVAGRQGTS